MKTQQEVKDLLEEFRKDKHREYLEDRFGEYAGMVNLEVRDFLTWILEEQDTVQGDEEHEPRHSFNIERSEVEA